MRPLSARKKLIVIACVFMLPLIVAVLMRIGVIDILPQSRTNRGILVQPPLAMEWPAAQSEALGGRWVLAVPLPARCNDRCEHRLAGLRQLHLALGRQQAHVRIFLIAQYTDVALDFDVPQENSRMLAIYPYFDIAPDRDREFSGPLMKARSRALETGPDSADGIYLIDPQGRIMMYYHQDTDPNDIKSDVEHLLKHL
jgi:hypothetical protein